MAHCKCCGQLVVLRPILRVVREHNLLCRGERIVSAPRRVVDLAQAVINACDDGITPLAAAAEIGIKGNVPLLYIYATKLRQALRPLSASLVQTDGRYRIEYA
jgi:hypothetical protein